MPRRADPGQNYAIIQPDYLNQMLPLPPSKEGFLANVMNVIAVVLLVFNCPDVNTLAFYE